MSIASNAGVESPSPFQGDHILTWRPREITLPVAGRIAVFECGPADEHAPLAVMVHGLGHWAQGAWDPMAMRLGKTHRIIAFDLPGFGASDKPDVRYDLPFFIETLHGIVQALHLTPFMLLGHSLGGMIAADYAAAYPDEVTMLTLLAPAGFLRTPKIFVRIVAGEPVSRFFSLRPSRRFVHGLLEQTFYDQTLITDEMYEHAYELSQDPGVCRAFLRVYAGALRDFLDMPGFHVRLARYAGPTFLVWGREDRFIPMRALANARKVYPQADVLLLERCGHSPNVEMPDHIVRRLLSGPTPRAIYSHELTAVQYTASPPYHGVKPADDVLASHVRERVFSALEHWARERGVGYVVSPHLRSDVAYLLPDREVPEATVKILAPGQSIDDPAENIRILLAAGCRLVIVIDPYAEYAVLYDTARVQRIDHHHRLAHPALPGFEALLASFFETL
jgi:pimeloyl-ACP methyl ester carboxylesterase